MRVIRRKKAWIWNKEVLDEPQNSTASPRAKGSHPCLSRKRVRLSSFSISAIEKRSSKERRDLCSRYWKMPFSAFRIIIRRRAKGANGFSTRHADGFSSVALIGSSALKASAMFWSSTPHTFGRDWRAGARNNRRTSIVPVLRQNPRFPLQLATRSKT
jgi:hypothetical protein